MLIVFHCSSCTSLVAAASAPPHDRVTNDEQAMSAKDFHNGYMRGKDKAAVRADCASLNATHQLIDKQRGVKVLQVKCD